ncbi:MAG: hypothetical protein PHF37_04700 [Phycisphaerae bacterium]|nr:hypothetical protein [Phycisphaerae bacterium]
MAKNTALKILNPLLGLVLVSQAVTGLFGAKIGPEAFEVLHKDSGIVLAALVALHVALNFNWVKGSYFRKH